MLGRFGSADFQETECAEFHSLMLEPNIQFDLYKTSMKMHILDFILVTDRSASANVARNGLSTATSSICRYV